MTNQFYKIFDEQCREWVASLVMIFVICLCPATEVRGQQCAEMLTTVSWDTLTWTPEDLQTNFIWPLIDGMEDVNVSIEVIPVDEMLGAGGFVSNFPKIDSGISRNFGLLADLGIAYDPDDGSVEETPIEIRMSFNPPVRCVSFVISDIDAITDPSGLRFVDSLFIVANDSVLPEFTALSPSMIPSFTADTGQVLGLTPVLAQGQDGDLLVDFRGTLIETVTVRYLDAITDGSRNERGIGLFGNLTYSKESLLPVELLSFDVDKDDNCHPMIKWETTHEYDLEYYAIEYSYDGINFSNAAIVQPKNTYTGINRYEEVIDRKLNTDNYFRLVKKELDGSQSILALDAIDGRGCYAFNSVNVYPNPAYKSHFYLEIESSDAKSSEIIIYDQTGRVMSKADYALNPGTNWFKVSSKSFAPGTYFVQFKSDDEVMTRKVHIIN